MKPQQKTKEIVKHQPTNGALTEVPKYLQREAGTPAAGFEEVQSGDMTVPQMRLCQSLTPQRDKQESKYIPGLDEGSYFNTVTGENYGDTVKIVPLMFFKNRVYFQDKKQGGGILCRSDDMKTGSVERGDHEDGGTFGGSCATCPMAQFGTAKGGEGKGKACTEFYNF